IKDLADNGLFNIRSDGTLVASCEVTAVDDNAKAMFKKYFGGKETLAPAGDNDVYTAYGSNSTLEVSTDGEHFTTYTSATNLFTFDGTTINLSNVKEFKAETDEDYITVETKKDTSGIKDVLKGFVEDYNKLLEDLYKEVNTKRPQKNKAYFDPLTDEQKDEMDADEIEKWEEQAKQGLLYRDNNIQKFLSEIRSVMSSAVGGVTLRDMGIKLTGDWRDNGKLEIDEAKMDSAIEAYGDKIADFFTGTNGLAAKLENTIDKAISTKTKKYGYLTSLAGMTNTKTDTDNQIYKEMQSIQKIIDKLNEKYEKEQSRYWNQFTALEKYMSMMQQQASYFMQE
ncbi:MAG: flagellar filament capping protein FliD, partial [Oscillospiraceae bacterium]|nr:flagellar filament capping protein FliD [Oscillospiraceae bacterium]